MKVPLSFWRRIVVFTNTSLLLVHFRSKTATAAAQIENSRASELFATARMRSESASEKKYSSVERSWWGPVREKSYGKVDLGSSLPSFSTQYERSSFRPLNMTIP